MTTIRRKSQFVNKADSQTSKPVIDSFQAIKLLSEKLTAALERHFEILMVPKKTILFEPGGSPVFYVFSVSGIARSFYRHDGKEITRRFMLPGGLVNSVVSYTDDSPYTDFTEAVTDCVFAVIPASFFKRLCGKYSELDEIAKFILHGFIRQERDTNRLLNIKTPTDKVSFFKELYPGLIGKISDGLIISFLSISRSSLSVCK
jgi:CRP-like cAMP-binding protein